MGLLKKRNVKIITENRNGKDEYILDCMKLKEPMELGKKLLLEFMKEKECWLFIDTNFTYERDNKIVEVNINKIQDLLTEKEIPHISKERMVDKDVSLMGIPLKKKKIKEFKMVIKVTEDVINNLDFFFNYMSVFAYITTKNKGLKEIWELHDQINVEGEDYATMLGTDKLDTFLYMDNYFNRIRIASEKDMDIHWIEKTLQ